MARRPLRKLLTGPLFDRARQALPALSATEREALAAGDVWWDAELFSGDPDRNKLVSLEPPRLNDEEQAFLDGPVQQLCALVDDWRVSEEGDLPEEAPASHSPAKTPARTPPPRATAVSSANACTKAGACSACA